MIKGLKDSKYDVVFCSYVENEEDIVFDLLFKDELILIVPIGHPLSKVESIDLKDIHLSQPELFILIFFILKLS